MGNNRHIHKQISHAIEHIENGDYELALNLLRGSIKEDELKVREADRDGKHTNSKS